MRSLVLAFLVLVATQVSCRAGETPSQEAGFRFYDSKTQSLFIKALRREDIPFQIESDGTVIYEARYEERVSKIRLSLLHDAFAPSYHFADEALQNKFIEQLKAAGIKFAVEVKYGKRWVTWSKHDDKRVQAIRETVLNSR